MKCDEIKTVFRTVDLGLVAVAKSLLEAEDIEYTVKNENFGTIFNGIYSSAGMIEIQVHTEDFAVARQCLLELQKEAEE